MSAAYSSGFLYAKSGEGLRAVSGFSKPGFKLRNGCFFFKRSGFLSAEIPADKPAGASSLECLSSIVDRLSSVESGCGLRDASTSTSTFSPGSTESQPCTPESPGARPVYHVL